MVLEKLRKKFFASVEQALKSGWTADQLALSFCCGLYIAFSPFPGGHTLLMIAFKFLFKLNFPLLFLITSINNPWTMIPFFSLDYSFGYWVTHSLLGMSPTWTISLAKIFGHGEICLWSFFIGGNILGIVSALVCYPFVRRFFFKLVNRYQTSL
jgi:uncharacterized protein (DUF2062 family)